MKRAIIAVLMIVFITVFSALSNNIIKKRVTSLLDNTVDVSANFDKFDKSESERKISELISQWKSAEKLLLLLDSHDKFENISELFGLLETVKNSDGKEIKNILNETENAIRIYLVSRKITVRNILNIYKTVTIMYKM